MAEVTAQYEWLEPGALVWEDETFAIHAYAPCTRLEDSLRRFGMMHPPWIWARENGTGIIVDGFKRLQWIREEGCQRVGCMLFPARYDPSRLMLERLETKLFGADPNVAEKAQIISKLKQAVQQEAEFKVGIARLGIAPRPDTVAKWCRLAISGDQLLQAAALEEICERAALELAEWENEPRSAAVEILRRLRCSASIQMEILERVKEIALREGIPKHQVWKAAEVAGAMSDPNKNHREKTRILRERLYRRRYPRVRAREERFAKDLSLCELPAGCRLIPPPAFEGDNWQLHLGFQNVEGLQHALSDIGRVAASDQFQKTIKSSR